MWIWIQIIIWSNWPCQRTSMSTFYINHRFSKKIKDVWSLCVAVWVYIIKAWKEHKWFLIDSNKQLLNVLLLTGVLKLLTNQVYFYRLIKNLTESRKNVWCWILLHTYEFDPNNYPYTKSLSILTYSLGTAQSKTSHMLSSFS